MGEFHGITRAGRYKRKDGFIVDLEPSGLSYYPWKLRGSFGGALSVWKGDGSFDMADRRHFDLIEGPLADDTEMAGLRGYGIFRQGYCTFVPPHELAALNEVSAGEIIIDLKTIRKDQIVKPEPKRETRKVTLVMWKNGAIDMWRGPPPVDPKPNPNIVAIVEREIEFTVGEGLEVKS